MTAYEDDPLVERAKRRGARHRVSPFRRIDLQAGIAHSSTGTVGSLADSDRRDAGRE